MKKCVHLLAKQPQKVLSYYWKEGLKMAKASKDYFGFGKIISIILAIIPFTAWLLGALTRFSEGKIVAGIIRLIGLGFILWLVDIVLMVTQGRILRLLNC